MKRKVFVFLLVLTTAFVSAACGTPQNSSDANTSDAGASDANTPVEITAGLYLMPNGLDPLSEDSVTNYNIIYHVYDRLVAFDPESNEWIPAVAKSWERVDDVTWKFEINMDYKFSNGDALTMDDVVYSLLRIKDVPKSSETGNMIKDVTYEGNTLTVTCISADITIPARILSTAVIVDKAYIESVGDDALYKSPIGTGPYVVTEFTPGASVTLEVWNDYPFEKPSIDKINIIAIAETASRYIALETGQVQFANNFTPFETEMVSANDSLVELAGQSRLVLCMIFNCERPPFDNVNVRRALISALDIDGFCTLEGGRLPIRSVLFAGYDDLFAVSKNLPEYNLETAKAMLEAEGYNASNPLKVTVLVNSSGDPGLEMYQSALQSIGVDMSINISEFSVYLAAEGSGDFDMLFTPQMNRNNHAILDLDRFDYNMIGTRDLARYYNDRVQELVEAMRFESDQQKLKEMSIEINDIIGQEVPMSGVYLMESLCAMDKRLSGVVVDRNRIIDFRYATFAE
jgi:peptide/nickel transport system substrate-binding protein